MSNFEEMYKIFNLDAEQMDHLNKLASKRYPFEENWPPVYIETVVVDGAKETRKVEGVVNAKLV